MLTKRSTESEIKLCFQVRNRLFDSRNSPKNVNRHSLAFRNEMFAILSHFSQLQSKRLTFAMSNHFDGFHF